ncbi:MAG: DNA primase, partial [Pseudomonadota bacterium]
IDIANQLANEALGRSLDELPPQTRRLLNLIGDMATQGCQQQGLEREDLRFSRRQVREYTGWGHSQLAVHLQRLEAMEYLLVHRGGHGRSLVYELVYATPLHSPSLRARLTDVAQLRRNHPATVRPPSGPPSGVFPALENGRK